jgi:hypothetical protein
MVNDGLISATFGDGKSDQLAPRQAEQQASAKCLLSVNS